MLGIIDRYMKNHVLVYLTNRYYNDCLPLPSVTTMRGLESVETITLKNGCSFYMNRHSRWVPRWISEYNLSGMLKTDIVLDIGANVGCFAVPAAKRSKYVIAVEPIFGEYLKANAGLNNLDNIVHVRGALWDVADGLRKKDMSFDGVHEYGVDTYSFLEIVDTIREFGPNARKPDFLKCDCEFGEKFIRPEDLLGIRRIEMELHHTDDLVINTLRRFIHANWDTYETRGAEAEDSVILHAFPKNENRSAVASANDGRL